MSLRAALYARISVSDAKTPAIEKQLERLRELAAREGYEVVRELADDGISAWSGKFRPAFRDLMEGVRRAEFDVLLAVADDRFARNDEEAFLLRSESAARGVKWHTLAQGVTDPSKASGALLAKVSSAIAQYESDVKRERIRRSVEDRLSRGVDLMGPRPFGFEPDRATIREVEADLLRAAYSFILEGGSVYGAARMFTASGVKRDRAKDSAWRTQTVRHILLRERNAGRLVVKGVQYRDDLSRIIDPDTFEAVRAILTNPDRAPKRGPKPVRWAATGIVRCGVCGGYLTTTGARGGVTNFRCASAGGPQTSQGVRHPTIRAETLDSALSALVRLRLTPRTLESPDSTPKPVAALRLRLAELVRQRDVVQELATVPGANIAKAKKEIAALGAEIEKARADLDAALATDVTSAAVDAALAVMVARAEHDDYDPDDEWGSTDRGWRDYWSGLSVDDRRALVRGLGLKPKLWPTSAPRRLTTD